MSELLIYKASAGSGKTFTLAVEYIAYLILNPNEYKHILAATFTNKATGEMKERILQQLYGIWQNLDTSKPYLKSIMLKLPGYNENTIRENAGKALLLLIHDYQNFRIETIDSFFQKIFQNVARELNLTQNLTIELNQDAVIEHAVDRMINELTPLSPVLQQISTFITEKIEENKSWRVYNELKVFGKNIFNEEFQERSTELQNKILVNSKLIQEVKTLLNQNLEKYLDHLSSFIDGYDDILTSYQLEDSTISYGSTVRNFLKNLTSFSTLKKITVGSVIDAKLTSPNSWIKKSICKNDQDKLKSAIPELMDLLNQANHSFLKLFPIINSCVLTRAHLNQLQLLNNIRAEVVHDNNESNKIVLSDINKLLFDLLGENDSSFIYEKIGTSIHHIMIDEFQDTSRLQWTNFRLLLNESLANGYDSLIVGDVKQAIYRWRNGDWSILNSFDPNNVSAQLPQALRLESLNTNYRSEDNIIEFNNHFFEEAAENQTVAFNNTFSTNRDELLTAYHNLTQEKHKGTKEGYVQISFYADDKENDVTYENIILREIGKEVMYLLSAGISENDIVILARQNKHISMIANYLDTELHISTVSDEAFKLQASTSVNLLIDALKVLQNQNDRIAISSLTLRYNRNADKTDEVLRDPLPYLPEAFRLHMDDLRKLPLYDLLEELYRIFELNINHDQDSYLFHFFDKLSEYIQNNSADMSSFLKYWDDEMKEEAISTSSQKGIRILSIHKSKGLEFNTVIIPFCDWQIYNSSGGLNKSIMWCSPSEEPFNELPLVPVEYNSATANSIYKPDYETESINKLVDNVNLLYVAFTRASANLFVMAKRVSDNKVPNELKTKGGTVSEILANTLPLLDDSHIGACSWINHETEANITEENFVYKFGELKISDKSKTLKEDTNSLNKGFDNLNLERISYQPDVEFRQSNKSASFISSYQPDDNKLSYIDRGKMMHNLFSYIQTLEDFEIAIHKLLFEGIIESGTNVEELKQYLHDAFQLEKVQEWYSGKWSILSERDIIWMENESMKVKRPDRVLILGNQINVLDFKFGKPSAKYNNQVKEYVSLIKNMTGTNFEVTGYLWYVDEKMIERI